MMKRDKPVKGTSGMIQRVTPGSVALEIITIILALIAFIPVLWMAVVSLKTDEASIPSAFHYFLPVGFFGLGRCQ